MGGSAPFPTIEDVEAGGRLRVVKEDGELLPGIRVMHTPVHTEGGLTVIVTRPPARP